MSAKIIVLCVLCFQTHLHDARSAVDFKSVEGLSKAISSENQADHGEQIQGITPLMNTLLEIEQTHLPHYNEKDSDDFKNYTSEGIQKTELERVARSIDPQKDNCTESIDQILSKLGYLKFASSHTFVQNETKPNSCSSVPNVFINPIFLLHAPRKEDCITPHPYPEAGYGTDCAVTVSTTPACNVTDCTTEVLTTTPCKNHGINTTETYCEEYVDDPLHPFSVIPCYLCSENVTEIPCTTDLPYSDDYENCSTTEQYNNNQTTQATTPAEDKTIEDKIKSNVSSSNLLEENTRNRTVSTPIGNKNHTKTPSHQKISENKTIHDDPKFDAFLTDIIEEIKRNSTLTTTEECPTTAQVQKEISKENKKNLNCKDPCVCPAEDTLSKEDILKKLRLIGLNFLDMGHFLLNDNAKCPIIPKNDTDDCK